MQRKARAIIITANEQLKVIVVIDTHAHTHHVGVISSYGAELSRVLVRERIHVVEVIRPNRQGRGEEICGDVPKACDDRDSDPNQTTYPMETQRSISPGGPGFERLSHGSGVCAFHRNKSH